MKRIIVITYSLFLFFSVSGQIEPPVLEFNDLTPNWLYISKDSNFIKSELDPFSSPYWGRQPLQLSLMDDKVFILERMISQSPYTGIEGYLLHCLNYENGTMNWIHFNNSYSGNSYRELLNVESLKFFDMDQVEILTYKAIDSINFDSPHFGGFYSTPKRKVLNIMDGKIVLEQIGNNETEQIYNFASTGNRLTYTGEGDLVQFNLNYYIKDNSLRNSIDVYGIDNDLNIISPFVDSIEFDTHLNISEFASFAPNYYKLNKDTMIAMFAAPNPEDFSYSPSLLELRWVDISSVNSFGELSKIDITESVYYPQSPFNGDITLRTIDDAIFIYQPIFDTGDAPIDASAFNWFTWYDKNGNLIRRIPFLGKDDTYYYLIEPIGVRNGIAYVAGYHNGTYDIISIAPDSDDIIVLKTIEVVNSEMIKQIFVPMARFISDDEILMDIRVVIENEEGRDTYFEYYYNFPVSEFGISTSVSEVSSDIELTVYPNPAKNHVSINSPIKGYLELYDSFGGKVKVNGNHISNSWDIDVQEYMPGLYTIILRTESGVIAIKKLLII